MRVSREWRLYVLGILLCGALIICSQNFADRGGPRFMAALAVAVITYLLALHEFFRNPNFSGRVIAIGLILAAAWHIAFLRLPPGTDDDIHRYVWDGRMQRLGYNPYIIVPSDPALASLHTTETRGLNNPELPTPYPPGAELFFRAATAVHESVFALKVAFVICDFAIVFLLLDVLRRSGEGKHWVLAYSWNPLLAIELAGSGHIDVVGALLLVISVFSLLRRWRALAAVAFALAVSVKLLPIVLLPLYWKRVRIRDAALAVAIFVLLYLPFVDQGRIPLGSLGTFVHSFRFNDPVFATLERLAPPEIVAALAVIAGLLIAIWMRRGSENLKPESFAWPMAGALLCAPVVYPWYLLWPLPFLRSAATLPLMIWTVSIVPVYYVWHLRTGGHPWVLPGWIMLLEYGSVALTAVVVFLRIRQPAGLESSAVR